MYLKFQEMCTIKPFEILEQLTNDVYKSFEILEDKKESQYLRRMTVRTVFSFIECIPQIIKYEIRNYISIYSQREKEHNALNINLSEKEKDLLTETTTRKDNTKVNIIIPIDLNIKQTFKLAIKIWNIEKYKLNTDSKEYEYFLHAKNVRNKLTHPKKVDDIIIDDIDMGCLSSAFEYCQDNFALLFKSIQNEFHKKEMEKFEKLFKESSKKI